MNKIVLGVCSSISIYKSCYIIRLFQEKGYQVHVIMTQNATELISPQLFQALSGNEVAVKLFGQSTSKEAAHIALARDPRLFLVAPATANVIGKFASGIADDFMSTFFMAVKCPVTIAPAMHENMYLHRQTQENIQKLKTLGIKIIDPEKGLLASGDEGWGRLASSRVIVENGLNLIQEASSLKGTKVLVTAGPTREYLDPIRFISNPSSGKMGFALAEAALSRGAEVTLIAGPTHLFPPPAAKCILVESALEMESEVKKFSRISDVVIMAAAVSDFRFNRKYSQKVKKNKLPSDIGWIRNPDILENLGKTKGKKILVGFAAESENIEENALQKLKLKNLDLMVANDISQEGLGFASDWNRVSIFSQEGKSICTERKSKIEISDVVMDEIVSLIEKRRRKTT